MTSKFCILILLFISLGHSEGDIDFNKLKTWQLQDETLVYTSDNLWEYIDGAADLFLGYGFAMLYSQDVQKDSLGATIDIYDMNHPLNAFGVYSTERSTGGTPIDIGAEAVIFPPYQCLMLKDRYYIKINVHTGQIDNESGSALLREVADLFTGSNQFPAEFDLLPELNQIPGSIGYTRESYQGLSELNRCLYAEYRDSTADFQLFLILNDGAETWNKLPAKWISPSSESDSIRYRKIPYKGILGITPAKPGLLGISGISNEKEIAFFLDRYKRLVGQNKKGAAR